MHAIGKKSQMPYYPFTGVFLYMNKNIIMIFKNTITEFWWLEMPSNCVYVVYDWLFNYLSEY